MFLGLSAVTIFSIIKEDDLHSNKKAVFFFFNITIKLRGADELPLPVSKQTMLGGRINM